MVISFSQAACKQLDCSLLQITLLAQRVFSARKMRIRKNGQTAALLTNCPNVSVTNIASQSTPQRKGNVVLSYLNIKLGFFFK